MTSSRRSNRIVCFAVPLIFALLIHAPSACPQSPRVERVLPFEQADIEHALNEMHARSEAPVLSFDGVVEGDAAQLKLYQQPRYRYIVEVTRMGPEKTRVQVVARIIAWYADPDLTRAGNRALRSTGRLENDLLDRLEDRLKKTVWTLPSGPGTDLSAKLPTLEQEIARLRPRPLAEMSAAAAETPAATPASIGAELAAVRAQREAAEQQIAKLKAEVERLEKISGGSVPSAGYVVVSAGSAAVREKPEEKARILFQAEEQDQFEPRETQGAWTRVELSRQGQGWIKTAQLAAASTESAPPASSPAVNSSATAKPVFTTIREDTFPYSGEWKALQGKQAVFLVTRPAASISPDALGSAQLAFVKQAFLDHYRQSLHLPHIYSGVVVIFFGKKAGVAASTLALIRQWMEGTLSDAEFLKRSSLDPREAFRD
ncbi:MAG: hypothetical protein GZ088_05730 [Acidipila sp.]|nr:hypothetical protein [Acidipila sp.]